MFVDIPDGAILERIDVTDAENPQPVFSYLPESDIGRLQKQVAALHEQILMTDEIAVDLYEAQLAQEEINLAQDEALVEIYEILEGGN